MLEKTAILTRKQARGTVLSLLETNYPDPVAYQTLARLMKTEELPGVIRYLESKGYIAVQVPEEPSLKPLESSIIELSAHGVDLLEESLPEDPGILF